MTHAKSVGQTLIKGQVLSKDSTAITYANIYLKNIYDGGVSNDSGYFSFTSKAKGNVLLVVSFLGYKSLEIPLTIGVVSACILINKTVELCT